MEGLEDGQDFYSAFASSDDILEDSEILADTFRDLLAFESTPVADPCIYSATISSLSHNRLAREATALLRSYSARGKHCHYHCYYHYHYYFHIPYEPTGSESELI